MTWTPRMSRAGGDTPLLGEARVETGESWGQDTTAGTPHPVGAGLFEPEGLLVQTRPGPTRGGAIRAIGPPEPRAGGSAPRWSRRCSEAPGTRKPQVEHVEYVLTWGFLVIPRRSNPDTTDEKFTGPGDFTSLCGVLSQPGRALSCYRRPTSEGRSPPSPAPVPSADVHGYAPALRSTASMWCPYRESPLLHTAPSTHMATR